jgi:hypothetical protein
MKSLICYMLINILYILKINKFIELYPNTINEIKYLHSTKSCDISQQKNVNCHEHNLIGH